MRSTILTHFIKGKISLSPMETILTIPWKLESLESFQFGKKEKGWRFEVNKFNQGGRTTYGA
jgi:hypothetical protein